MQTSCVAFEPSTSEPLGTNRSIIHHWTIIYNMSIIGRP